MKIQDRAEAAIVNNIDKSLAILQEELAEVGFNALHPQELKAYLVKKIHAHYEQDDSEDSTEPLIEFGSGAEYSPQSLATSIVCHHFKKWLKDAIDFIETIENVQDAKLKKWVHNQLGRNGSIDFTRLVVVKSEQHGAILSALRLIHQVLSYERSRLQSIVVKIDENAEGEKALIRDLGQARLSDEKMERVLCELVKLQDAKIIDQVVSAQEVATSKYHPAIAFMASVLKKRLELGVNDEDWQDSATA